MNKVKITPEILQEMKDYRQRNAEVIRKYGLDWRGSYLNNFHMFIKNAENPEETYKFLIGEGDIKERDLIAKLPETPYWAQIMSETRKDKTEREFYADIKNAIAYCGFESPKLYSKKPEDMLQKTKQLMRVFLRLRGMGYNRFDLIG